jgi:SAM-dependent methyltransferase
VNTEGKAEIRTCRAQDNNTDRNSVESELFRSAIGGYGLFGIMTEVTLKVVDNVHLELDSMILSLQCPDMEEESEFVRIYDNCRGQNQHLLNGELSLGSTGLGVVEIKIARMNTINLEKASLYVFRKNSDASSVSDLPVAPRELTPTSRLLYKWLLPLAKEMRYSKEEKSGEALDWNQNDIMTKNHLLYESAVPMATLYNPLVKKNDTFVLQEFFCPHDKFSEWIEKAKPIYKELEREQHKKEQEIILLNTTIRYVEKDDCTVLSYSRDEKGSFAFVLYFRIDIDEEVEKRLGVIHNKLAEITCSLGGTFYLPYRRCYSQQLLKRAYPMIGDFAKLKEKYDPHTIFGNLFFDDYILPLCSEEYQAKWSLFHLMTDEGKSGLEKPGSIVNPKEFSSWLPRSNQSTLVRRNNSYRTLLRSKTMRDDFRQKFLVNIFHLVDPNEVMRAMTRFAWDPKNIDDIQIYKCLFKYFNSEERGAVSKVRQKLRALEQLNQQKNELTRQTVSILSKLGKLDSIHSYACFGDNGKTVQRFVKDLSIDGMIYVVHDADVDKENKSMPALTTMLERGSLNSVADKHIKYDYISDNAALKLSCIPSGSIDLITMNQGLHHIPIEKLHGFLVEVNRILSPNGVFIIREHDLEVNGEDGKVPYAMLDLAHSVFNAVTGVPIAEEQIEIRAFRSISEWREVVEKVGFLDTRIYEVEDGDPTWDEMMAFVKNVDGDVVSSPLHEGQVHKTWSNEYPSMKEFVATLLQQIPQSFLTTVMNLLDKINDCMPKIQNMISSKLLNGIPELIKEANLNPLVSKDIMKQIVNVIEPSASEIIRQI